jgi:ribosomal 30S subunit maturation factor RimM
MFAIAPGMAVTDARGKVIGHVQELRQTSQGVVQAVTVEVGNRVATLPAANFAGSGDVLVTGMTKGQLKNAAEQQDANN